MKTRLRSTWIIRLTGLAALVTSLVAVPAAGAPAVAATAGVPGVPGWVWAAPGNSTATVSWVGPDSGGSPITAYVVTPYIGAVAQPPVTFNSPAGTEVVPGLANGTTYTFKVVARNSNGSGSSSAATNPVIIGSPSAPAFQQARPGNGQATVTWWPPSGNGSPITGWVVTPYLGSTALTARAFRSTLNTQVVTGLTNGLTYTFTVAAINGRGTGRVSGHTAGLVVTPTPPGRPDFASATPGNGQAALSWWPPVTNGSPITGSVVTPVVGSVPQAPRVFSGTSNHVTVTGLTNGTSYTFRIAATNAAGTGPYATTAAIVPVKRQATAITGGRSSHTCAVFDNGTVACWGHNNYGQLGDGTNTDRSVPVTVPGLTGATQVVAGYDHSCALINDGTVRCWGANYYSQLGNGLYSDSVTPVAVSGLTDAKAITTGSYHSCALRKNGTVRCWGNNGYGQTGGDSLTGVVAVAGGQYHTCALLGDGTVRCWGYNNHGQLGNGNTNTSSSPVTVQGLSGVTAIALGYEHSCALRNDGTAACWGWDVGGQLGDNAVGDQYTPVAVQGVSGIAALSVGDYHSCARRTDSTETCWGANWSYQIGNNSLTGVAQMAAGATQTCALLGDGTAKCWGDNSRGRLGDGTTNPGVTPVTVLGL